MSDKPYSRRELFTFWRRPPAPAAPAPAPAAEPAPTPLRAELQWQTCLAFLETPCVACHLACPVDNVIGIDDHGHPRVDRYLCTGCGECEKVCPTRPASIVLRPLLF